MTIARWVAPSLLLALVPTVGLTNQYEYDPPMRVARLSYVDGPASLRPGGVDEWTDATLNYPLTAGDDIWTDAARMEITIGSAALRLAPNSAFGFLALDDYTTQVRLSDGALQIRLRDLDACSVRSGELSRAKGIRVGHQQAQSPRISGSSAAKLDSEPMPRDHRDRRIVGRVRASAVLQVQAVRVEVTA